MMKRFSCLLILSAACLTAIGCGGQSDDSPVADQEMIDREAQQAKDMEAEMMNAMNQQMSKEMPNNKK